MYRLIYFVGWLIALIVFFTPWVQGNGEVFSGWEFVVPFSFPYLIGLLLGLIVLLTKKLAFGLSLISGILMFISIILSTFGIAIFEFVGSKPEILPGIAFAFLWSLIYTVFAPIIGKKMS